MRDLNRLKALIGTGMPEVTLNTMAAQITKGKKKIGRKKFNRSLDLRGGFILVPSEETLRTEDTASQKWNIE